MLKAADEYIAELETKITDLQCRVNEKSVHVVLVPEKCTRAIKWEDLEAYMVKLAEPTHFADDDKLEFDRMVVLCRREFEKEFLFSDMPLYLPDDEIDVIGQAASAWLVRVAWLPDGIPMMLCTYTERDVEEFMDIVIDADAIKTLKERVLERMHLNMLDAYRKYEDRIEQAEFLAEKDRADKEILLRKIKERLALMDNDTKDTMDDISPTTSLKTWQLLLLALGWVLFATLLIIVLVQPASLGGAVPTNSTTPAASVGLTLLRFIRMWGI